MSDYHTLEGGTSQKDNVPFVNKNDDKPTILSRQ